MSVGLACATSREGGDNGVGVRYYLQLSGFAGGGLEPIPHGYEGPTVFPICSCTDFYWCLTQLSDAGNIKYINDRQ